MMCLTLSMAASVFVTIAPVGARDESLVWVYGSDEVLKSLASANGTAGVVVLDARVARARGRDAALILLGWTTHSLPEDCPLFLGIEGIGALPDLPAQLRGTYSENRSGKLIPMRRGEDLPTLPIPGGVKRGIVSAAGVEVVYAFEDGVPAVMVVEEDPPIVLVSANLSEWAMEDPGTLLAAISALLDYLNTGVLLPPEFFAASLAGTAVLVSLRAAIARRRSARQPQVGARAVRSEVLSHPVRAVLLSLLDDVGAASVSELSDELQIPRSTLSHHLAVMERSGLVKSEEMLGERVYFLPGRRQDAAVRAAMRNPTRRNILALLEREGPQPIRSLAEGLGVSTETVKRNVDILERLGLVETRRVRGKRIVSLTRAPTIYHVADAGERGGR